MSTQPLKTAFAGTANDYASYRPPYPDALLSHLRNAAGITGHSVLLDLACGPGRIAIPMASHFRRVVAIDIEPEMVVHTTLTPLPALQSAQTLSPFDPTPLGRVVPTNAPPLCPGVAGQPAPDPGPHAFARITDLAPRLPNDCKPALDKVSLRRV